jgi:hypothetical protein
MQFGESNPTIPQPNPRDALHFPPAALAYKRRKRGNSLPSMHDGSPVSGLAVLANGDVLAGTTFTLSRWKPGDDQWEELALLRKRSRGSLR